MKDICLNIASFKEHRRIPVIQKGLDSGVSGFLLTGTSSTASRIALEYAKKYPSCSRSTSGVHPHNCLSWDDSKESIYQYAQSSEVVAIGECGLDYDRNIGGREAQMRALRGQLDIAKELGKPVFLHLRPARNGEKEIMKDFISIFSGYANYVKGVVHCFTGDSYMLEGILDYDLSVGITGWVCDERRGLGLQELVPDIPDEYLMIETDAPYLTPRNMPKDKFTRENEPAYLCYVLDKVAHLRGQTTQEVDRITDENCKVLFGF